MGFDFDNFWHCPSIITDHIVIKTISLKWL